MHARLYLRRNALSTHRAVQNAISAERQFPEGIQGDSRAQRSYRCELIPSLLGPLRAHGAFRVGSRVEAPQRCSVQTVSAMKPAPCDVRQCKRVLAIGWEPSSQAWLENRGRKELPEIAPAATSSARLRYFRSRAAQRKAHCSAPCEPRDGDPDVCAWHVMSPRCTLQEHDPKLLGGELALWPPRREGTVGKAVVQGADDCWTSHCTVKRSLEIIVPLLELVSWTHLGMLLVRGCGKASLGLWRKAQPWTLAHYTSLDR